MAQIQTYRPEDFGKEEEKMMKKFDLQLQDAKKYFEEIIKPQLDRSYKLYMSDTGDRAKQIKSWQANVFVPYTQAVVETLMPRILDARPEFTVQGRNQNDQTKAIRVQYLHDYTWEISKADDTCENVVRSSLVYGTGFMQVSWKKDVRPYKFLITKNLRDKKYKYKEKDQVYYDAPYVEWVDNYSLWYDWHNIPRQSKQFWFKRLVLTGDEIKQKYPHHDKKRLAMAFEATGGDLTDFASVRNEIKKTHTQTYKGADSQSSAGGTSVSNDIYNTQNDSELKMHEVFEWWRPFDDAFAVMVNKVPILKGGYMPNPYDFKEATFIDIPYLKSPGEFEGIGLPIILENPQLMLNMIKNQRLDATILNIHKMWIVNPFANIDKNELVTRPFGIIYSTDPNGVREVQFTDIKPSSYREEELLKGDMRYASGVDDFSMGAGQGGGTSATEVRHLRESTLERVRLFINHLGSAYADVMRMWTSMYRQFFTKTMTVRVIGEDGIELFPLIEKDDLMGQYDFKAAVIPSIAGKNDIDKKQSMDLFQLLITMPFVDPKKLVGKVLHSWNWSLDSIIKKEEVPPSVPGVDPNTGLPIAGMEGIPVPQEGQDQTMIEPESGLPPMSGGEIPPDVVRQALAMLGGQPADNTSAFNEAGAPINLLNSGVLPPTAPGIKTNPRGMNRTGKVNTNIPVGGTSSLESNLLGRATNLQK